MSLYNAAAWLLDRQLDAGNGDRIAYRLEGRTVSYAELRDEVARAQHALHELDVRQGERVALVVDDELAFPAWFLGALRAGAVPVPLSTMLTADELAAIVADAGAGAVVMSAGYREHLAALAAGPSELRNAVVIGDPGAAGGLPVIRCGTTPCWRRGATRRPALSARKTRGRAGFYSAMAQG